ncbi:MAG TPA: hypothetical protein GX506_12550, partial [Firmicutes bacterium]|nr:hypothetical protein [Bacillota bacterium]
MQAHGTMPVAWIHRPVGRWVAMARYFELVRHDGNRPLFSALEISIISLLAGLPLHVHVEGLRGTGKTTIMRGAKDILPHIERIKGCAYNCDPAAPHCPVHRNMTREEIARTGTEWVKMPFLEISHSAKIGTVVGSIDLGRLVDPSMPEAALLPGILPRANRGIVFVDEINRLADTSPELTDVLLDVMGTKPGRLQVEEVGFAAFEMPITLSVWGASNPDEEPGPLEDVRRQLSDRFDFLVTMGRPGEVDVVREILEIGVPARWGKGMHDGVAVCEGAVGQADPALHYADLLASRSRDLPGVKFPSTLVSLLAQAYVDFGLESLRAIEAMKLGALARATLEGRKEATVEDVKAIASLALRHRVDISTLTNILKFLDEKAANAREERETKVLAGGVAKEPTAPAEHGGSRGEGIERKGGSRSLSEAVGRLVCALRRSLIGKSDTRGAGCPAGPGDYGTAGGWGAPQGDGTLQQRGIRSGPGQGGSR